jgi:hypothetical protein
MSGITITWMILLFLMRRSGKTSIQNTSCGECLSISWIPWKGVAWIPFSSAGSSILAMMTSGKK